MEINVEHFYRMDLTEFSVSVLVEYLYTGCINLKSNLKSLLEVAVAANCFQLQVLYPYNPICFA